MTKSISQCWQRFKRPYIGLVELPMFRGNNNLFLGLSSVLGLIGGAYLLQVGAQRLLRWVVATLQRYVGPPTHWTCYVRRKIKTWKLEARATNLIL